MRKMFLPGVLAGCSSVMLAWQAVASPARAIPYSGLAVTQESPAALSQPDVSLYFGNGLPPERLTVDARVVPDAIEEVKLPVGWVGGRVVAYATVTGQNAASEPLFVQRTDSPRRVLIGKAIIAAQPSPAGARLAMLGYTRVNFAATLPVLLRVADLSTGRTRTMTLPSHSAAISTGYGGMGLTWSPAGDRVAAAWIAPGGLRVAVCAVATGTCSTGLHAADVGLRSSAGTYYMDIGWISAHTLLVVVSPQFGSGPGSLAVLSADHPAGRAAGALAPHTHLARTQILTVSIAPTLDRLAIVEEAPSPSPPVLQISLIQGSRIAPTSTVTALGSGYIGGVITGGRFAVASAPTQAWSGDQLVYGELVNSNRSAATFGRVSRLDTKTGRRQLLLTGPIWAAIQPPGSVSSVIGRTQGACPVAPSAYTQGRPAFGFDAARSVRQTVSYYRALLQQALRLADGSCLGTVASGAALAAARSAVSALSPGETAVVPAGIHPRSVSVDIPHGLATESAIVGEGKSVYRGSRVVKAGTVSQVAVTYHLRLKSLGKPHGFPMSKWVVVSVTNG